MRYSSASPRTVMYRFGPGPMTPAVKLLLWANVGMFVLSWIDPNIVLYLGLQPSAVIFQLRIWQPITYLFLHASVTHILFNMLALWMFGVDLERLWGRDFFLKYYFIAGVGAAATTILLSLVPGELGAVMWMSLTIGASGAIYGLLVAYALCFPDRPIYIWALFPIPARVFVLIMGAIAFMSSVSGNQGGVANTAHLGGLVVGYLYLKTRGGHPLAEIRYRYVKWRMNRLRRRFDVHPGGRHDWDDRLH
jgi:membrane associated rhomboid family serine protease